MINRTIEKNALGLFRRERIMTVTQLAQALHCAIATVRNRLRAWNTFTSYNHNGRYYTLPDVPVFNQLGLWKYKGVSFSKHGNFTQTVRHLVNDSEMGLDAGEIGTLLGLLPRSFMGHLQRIPGIVREKQQGRFVYFSPEQESRQKQKQSRVDGRHQRTDVELPADAEAIQILADRIRHPGSSYEQTAHRLRRRGIGVKVDAVRALMAYHDLEKKTADTRSSKR